jgi:hypothetical protein
MNNQNTGLVVGIILVLLVAVFGYGYYLNNNKNGTVNINTMDTTTPPPPMTTTETVSPNPSLTESMTKTTTVNLDEQNDSGQSGTATLIEENGQTTVTLSLTGGTFTEPQPAHIHMGSCPKPGDVVHPLTNVVNGKSVTTLNVTMDQLKAQLPLAINVHKSASEMAAYTACGDVKL